MLLQLRKYLPALLVTLLAAILRAIMGSFFGPVPLFVTFYPAVILVALVGDIGPTLFAAALSVFVADYLFFEPMGSLKVGAPGDTAALVVFAFSSLLLAVIARRLKAGRDAQTHRKREARYRTYIDMTNEITWAADAHGAIVEDIPSWRRFSGQTYDEARGSGWAKALHPDDFERAMRGWKNAVAGGSRYEGEFRLRRHDGVYRDFLVRGVPIADEKGTVREWAGTCIDITDRKQAEEALRSGEEKFRRYFELGLIGMVLSSPAKGTLEVNDEFCRMLGYERDELLHMTFAQATHPDDLPANLAYANRLLAGEIDGYTMDKRLIRKDGKFVYVTMSVKCVRGKDGSIDYIVSLIQDVTHQKSLEEQLRQSQKMEAIGTLAGGVAHEFNNILTVIMGLGDIIQRSLDPGDRLRSHVDGIVASSEQAAELTRRLLAFSRKQRIEPQPREVSGAVAGAIRLLERLLPEDIELKVDLDDHDAVAMLDITQIDQVLMNLATNARDAMPNGGLLTISTKVAELDETFRESHGFGRPGRYALLSVSDNGVGMDETTMTRIFDPFFTTKGVGKGTGLGLSSVFGIVKQHNGYITVASRPLEGTTFDIYLPVVDMPERPAAVDTDDVTGGSETILVVEDNQDVRYMMATLLADQGYTILEAADGNDAIGIFSERRDVIDLVILDAVMPGRNGMEVFDEIARHHPPAKAIFISGYAGDILTGKGVQKENIDFLQKPLSVAKLLTKVREVLDR